MKLVRSCNRSCNTEIRREVGALERKVQRDHVFASEEEVCAKSDYRVQNGVDWSSQEWWWWCDFLVDGMEMHHRFRMDVGERHKRLRRPLVCHSSKRKRSSRTWKSFFNWR